MTTGTRPSRSAALEAVWSVRLSGSSDLLVPSIVRRLGDPERAVRFAAARLVGRLDESQARTVGAVSTSGDLTARLWFTFGRCERRPELNLRALNTAVNVFEKTPSSTLREEALRVMEIALGDCGPGRAVAPMFEGYTSRLDLRPHEGALDPARIRVARLFPTHNAGVDYELARVIAMLGPANDRVLDAILAQITADSDPVNDIHYLAVAARIPVERGAQQTETIARALVELEPKLAAKAQPGPQLE